MKYKVLITTSGTGSRLGETTKYLNKALINVGDKPAISYIIDAYPQEVEFVITLGYLGEQVKDLLEMIYTRRKFTFVQVDKYEGEGSSPAYSILQCKKELQCPFIFHACDTLVFDKIPTPATNWAGGYKSSETNQYASFKNTKGTVRMIFDKGQKNTDYLHIGLVGIKNYQMFWKELETLYKDNKNDQTLTDIHVINKMIIKGALFNIESFKEWYDFGNVPALNRLKEHFADNLDMFDKIGETNYLYDGYFIKFYHDKGIAANRVLRAKLLDKLVPKIISSSSNFYKYKYVMGDLYADVVTPEDFSNFLKWTKINLWKKSQKLPAKEFENICCDFYFEKTKKRVNEFLKINSIADQENIINKERIPSIEYILKKINKNWIKKGIQSYFHGDFILDNIIKTKKSYILIDWRQDFGGSLTSGDMYYDLAKMNHNLVLNHNLIRKNLFTIEIKGNKITCDILRSDNLVQCQKVLHEFIKKEKYNQRKVDILTAIAWINMSPLHPQPYSNFLFYFGKLNLWRAIKNL